MGRAGSCRSTVADNLNQFRTAAERKRPRQNQWEGRNRRASCGDKRDGSEKKARRPSTTVRLIASRPKPCALVKVSLYVIYGGKRESLFARRRI